LFAGAPDSNNQIAISVPIANELSDNNALLFTLKQIAGIGRNFDWKIIRY
jgi:hypothetical protein